MQLVQLQVNTNQSKDTTSKIMFFKSRNFLMKFENCNSNTPHCYNYTCITQKASTTLQTVTNDKSSINLKITKKT